jgi:acyl-CoA reductase-like NAD-dependent aldehyde dehydrogenase
MKSIEIQKEIEAKLMSARLEAGFYIIGGERAVADSQLSVINPATGEELATVPNIAAITLDDAVAAARRAFQSWHAIPLERRKEAVARVLTEIEAHAEELSTLLTAEQGRPVVPSAMGNRSADKALRTGACPNGHS